MCRGFLGRRRLDGSRSADSPASRFRRTDDELPHDPDWDDVPPRAGALDGQRVHVTAWDRDDGILRSDSDVLVVVPQWFSHLREGDDVDA